MNCRSALRLFTGLIVAVAVISTGCDGGGGDEEGNGGPAAAPQGTATLTGTVVTADNPGRTMPEAEVIIEALGRNVVTGVNGQFTIENLPAGEFTVNVHTPQSETHGTASAIVPLQADTGTTVNFAVLPLNVETPQQIMIAPDNVTVDLNGQVKYRTQLVGPNNLALGDLEPTWVVRGGVGEMSPDGTFTARTVGTGEITAYAGNAQFSGTVVVVQPQPPRISSFQVNPRTLPATGGEIYASAAVSDGDGIRTQDVQLEILPAGGEPILVPMQVANPDSATPFPALPNTYLDASYQVTWPVPANDNTPNAEGVQAVETYGVSLRVRDRSGMTSQSRFIEFIVEGIDPPPPTPGL